MEQENILLKQRIAGLEKHILEKLSESDKPFHKQPPDDKDTISRIIGEYYFHSSLKSAKNIA